MMRTYLYTKQQAETAARATIANYADRYPNEWQDEQLLAFDVSALLGVEPEPVYVGFALGLMSELQSVEDGTHHALAQFTPGELLDAIQRDLSVAIHDITHRFPSQGRDVFVPTMGS